MNLLLSYPRTASTWTRYILECFSGQTMENHYDKKSVHGVIKDNGFKTKERINEKKIFGNMVHTVQDIREKPDKLVLSYRRAVEVIPSFQYSENHANKRIPIEQWMSTLRVPEIQGKIYQYLLNIKFYEGFDGPKMILKYDSLMNDPANTIEQLTRFFDVYDEGKLEKFMDNYEDHKSVNLKYKSLPKHMAVNTSGKTRVIEDMLPQDVREYLNSTFNGMEKK